MYTNDGDCRKTMRAHLSISETEITCSDTRENLTGSIRDISANGAFVYANLEPIIGTPITIRFVVQGALADTHIKCDGTVVRVEKSKLGGPTGIAIQFSWVEMAA